jgi:aminoglycoside phosphotransferase (APT) family kinase protein
MSSTMLGMANERAEHTAEWLAHFARAGYSEATPLAAGMEGAVYRLGDQTVAKVWRHRRSPEIILAQKVYDDIASHGLPFATPVILEVNDVNGVTVSRERELPGEPLQARLEINDRVLGEDEVECVALVLQALAGVPATDAMRQLPVLDEHRAFWSGSADFPSALAGLLQRRVARHGGLLRAHVSDFDRRYARILDRLLALDRLAPTVVHGDLLGSNILVDAALRPLSVLDLGFLTTAGDPRFDSAITASIMNMYGPHAAAITTALTERFAAERDCPMEVLVVYRAAYALATSNALTFDGSDGHFAWCVKQLNQEDLTHALRL